jgi:signal transduction histidine kinase
MRANPRMIQTAGMLRSINRTLTARVMDRTQELAELRARLRAEIRAREAAEAKLRQMQKMEAVGRLTSGIAHDFANMLTVIVGSLEIAQRRLAQGRTDIAGLLDTALDGGQRTTTLTRRLLDFARQQPHAAAVVDVNAVISDMAELLRRTLGETVALECTCAGGLWPTRIDPSQLESAILNLAVNARDAMPGGGRLRIATRNARLDGAGSAEISAGAYVVIEVTDTGTGMPPDVAARALDPFFTTKGEGQGTGLGLSQVRDFATQSEGRVEIDSELGRGTSVRILLPRHTDD